jgi:hypothetical protein
VQLRLKNAPLADRYAIYRESIELTRHTTLRLFINDDWQLALELKAYGTHLGQEDLLTADLSAIAASNLRLGVSTHDENDVQHAVSQMAKQDDVVLYTEQRADGLFILLSRADNGSWQLPMNPQYAPASATELYTFYLPDSMSRHLLTRYYRVAAADEPGLMERWQSDNPDTRYVWVSAAQLQQQDNGYAYDNHPVLYADALVAQSIYAGRVLPTWDTELSRAICETRQKPQQFVQFHRQRNDTTALARLARQGVVMDETTDISAPRP